MLAEEIRVLSEEQLHQVHEAALHVLAEGAMEFEEERLREQLRERGASDASTARQMHLPPELTRECIAAVAGDPWLCRVDGRKLPLDAGSRHYASLVVDPFVIDIRGEARRPTLDDVARHARLGDALPRVEQIHMMDDTIPDLAPHVSELRGIEAFVANTTTAYHCAPGSLEGTRYWIEIAEIMAGGSLATNPILGAYVPSVSPLVLTEFNTQQLRLFLEGGAVCNLGPCAIAGASAPFTTAGLLVQSWAELLASVVAAQAIAPGCATLGGGGGAHHMDMRSAQSMYSGVTKALASAAMNELSAWIGLPTISGNFTTLCANFGVQNGVESVFGAFATLGSPVNLFGHMGSMANAVGMSPAEMVIHHDLVETFEHFRGGIDTAADRLAVESIVAVGAHGSFLEEELTLDNLRAGEHDFASTFEVCEGTRDRATMAEHAHERAEHLMATHQPVVPADRLEQVRRYVENELAKLG